MEPYDGFSGSPYTLLNEEGEFSPKRILKKYLIRTGRKFKKIGYTISQRYGSLYKKLQKKFPMTGNALMIGLPMILSFGFVTSTISQHFNEIPVDYYYRQLEIYLGGSLIMPIIGLGLDISNKILSHSKK